MSRFNPTSKKIPEEFEVSQLRFLGEQDGPPERELKFRLAQFFRRDQPVITAYLVRIAYGGEGVAVALCLRTRCDHEQGLAEKVGKLFASIFGRHEHLDIIFLNQMQEAALANICKPFFHAGVKQPKAGEQNQI